jgi:hypothetical protein
MMDTAGTQNMQRSCNKTKVLLLHLLGYSYTYIHSSSFLPFDVFYLIQTGHNQYFLVKISTSAFILVYILPQYFNFNLLFPFIHFQPYAITFSILFFYHLVHILCIVHFIPCFNSLYKHHVVIMSFNLLYSTWYHTHTDSFYLLYILDIPPFDLYFK